MVVFHLSLHLGHEQDVVKVIPLFGTDAPLAGRLAPSVQYGHIDDVKDLLRVHVSTHPAGDFVCFKMVDNGPEVGQCVQWSSSEYRITAMIQDPQCIEAAEDVSAGLVYDCNDQGAIVGHLFEQVHQQF